MAPVSDQSRSSGFTLIELSIVLVILGLLVGGIIIGQAMVRNAELRAVSTEVNNLAAALFTFKLKYIAVPGDMVNATDRWGAADGGDGVGSDCGDEESETLTCNGNGDGTIDFTTVDGVWEKLRAWQQMANAGLIPGSYTGAQTAGVSYVGKQFPAARFKPAGYEISSSIPVYRKTGMRIKIAARADADTTGLNGGFLTPVEAQGLDSKMDDGLSDSGNLLAVDSNDIAGCVTNGTTYSAGTTGSYILTNSTDKSCRFYFFF